MPWEFNSPSFRFQVPLAERQRLQPSKLADQRCASVPGSTLAGHSRGSANGRPSVFEAGYEGSSPSPRTSVAMAVSQERMLRGSCCW
jgi:hypothetical protein